MLLLPAVTYYFAYEHTQCAQLETHSAKQEPPRVDVSLLMPMSPVKGADAQNPKAL